MNIIVLCGGLSIERDVSLATGALVTRALINKGHNAVDIDIIKDYDLDVTPIEYIETCRDRELIIPKVPKTAPDVVSLRKDIESKGNGIFGKNVIRLCQAADIVFMGLHGGEGEDGRIQAMLDLYNIKYTGSDSLGSAIAMSKRFSKQVYQVNNILSPEYRVVLKDEYNKDELQNVRLPVVAKISVGGSSLGVYIVDTYEELIECMDKLFEMDETVLIEEYIKGVEYTCGVFDGIGLPVVEIRPKQGFYDYENKYQEGATEEFCPAPSLNDTQTKLMHEISLKAHKALGLSVYSRTDFIVSDAGEMYCIETNTLPGMTPTSLLPQEALAIGIDYDELCHQMVTLSMKKYE